MLLLPGTPLSAFTNLTHWSPTFAHFRLEKALYYTSTDIPPCATLAPSHPSCSWSGEAVREWIQQQACQSRGPQGRMSYCQVLWDHRNRDTEPYVNPEYGLPMLSLCTPRIARGFCKSSAEALATADMVSGYDGLEVFRRAPNPMIWKPGAQYNPHPNTLQSTPNRIQVSFHGPRLDLSLAV